MAKNGSKCIETLEEYIEWTKQFIHGVHVFRGVSNEKYKIEASTTRRLKDDDGKFYKAEYDSPRKILELNEQMLEDARRQGHGTKDGLQLGDLDLLAELQHLGAATCLIDFTYNPLVALRIACRESSGKKAGEKINGRVYVVDLNPQDTTFQEITVELARSKKIGYFFKCDTNDEYKLYRWQPNYKNNRMRAQQSIFLFSGNTIKIFADCTISSCSKQAIRDALEQTAGITEGSLFPDFEGFASQRAHNQPHVEPDAQYCFDKGLEAEEGDITALAISYYNQGIRLKPDKDLLFRLYQNRASCNGKLGKFEEAISDHNEMITLNPGSAFSYYSRGNVNMKLEQYEDAIKDYDMAIDINPNYTAAYLDRGVAYAHLEQYEDAIKDYDMAIDINPNYIEAYLDRGVAYAHLEQHEDANQDFQIALQLAERDDNEELIAKITKHIDELKARGSRQQ